MDSENTGTNKRLIFSLFIFKSVMSVFYLAIGVMVLFTDIFTKVFINFNIERWWRIPVGVLFCLYGLFRVYRAYKETTLKTE